MTQFSRRQFIATSALSLAATRLRSQDRKQIQVNLVIPAEASGPHIPGDFIGLSYETREFTNPDFFSAKNTGLIRAFKALSPRGVLRLGGNTSEFGWWKPTPDSPEPEHPKTREVIGEPKASYYPVTPEAIRNLAAFLEATGWTCLYGINMGTNTPARAAGEAGFVAKTLGARLLQFPDRQRSQFVWPPFARSANVVRADLPRRVARTCARRRRSRSQSTIRNAGSDRRHFLAAADRRCVGFSREPSACNDAFAPLLLRRAAI